MNTRSRLDRTLILLLAILLTSSCAGREEPFRGSSVWIDVPVDGLAFPDVRSIQIEGHAASPDGIRQVEVRINGELWITLDSPPAEAGLARFETSWSPPTLGEYVIEVVAIAAGGATSQPDSARIQFGEERVQVTLPPEDTSTTPDQAVTPEAVVQFWADPAEIAAGACTSIRWHAENVQGIIFGGNPQELDGAYEACLCANERYSLFVTYLDGSEERLRLDVPVTGTCATDTPDDVTPPPAPVLTAPSNGSVLGCKGSQTVSWTAVSDPSGISQYQVQVQRHSGDNNWQDVSGSPFAGVSGLSHAVGVECGWYYRWRVRAVDGQGNIGPWSGWWTFAITLI
jgi:hypothetical protein